MPAIQLPLALAQRLVLRRQGRGSKPSPRSTRPRSPRRFAGAGRRRPGSWRRPPCGRCGYSLSPWWIIPGLTSWPL